MKMRSSVTAVFLAVILAVILCATAMASEIPSPTKDFYIYDGADVIDKSVEKYIIEKNKILEEKTDAQIVIVTVETTGDTEIKDYSSEIFTKWKIGDREKKNGLMLLLAVEDDNYWVSQGSGIEDRLTTSGIKTILDSYLEPHFAAGNYSQGVQTVFDKFISSYNTIYSIDVNNPDGEDSLAKNEGDISLTVLKIIATVGIIVILVIIVMVIVRRVNSVGTYITKNVKSKRTYPPRPARRINSPSNSRPRNTVPSRKSAPKPSGARRPSGSRRPAGAKPVGNPRPKTQNGSRSPQSRSGHR